MSVAPWRGASEKSSVAGAAREVVRICGRAGGSGWLNEKFIGVGNGCGRDGAIDGGGFADLGAGGVGRGITMASGGSGLGAGTSTVAAGAGGSGGTGIGAGAGAAAGGTGGGGATASGGTG